jgi:predicted MFS family arabinose efflux permease
MIIIEFSYYSKALTVLESKIFRMLRVTPQTLRFYGATTAATRIGTGFFFLINTWLIIDITGRPSSAAITLLISILPGLLLSPIIGVAVDRHEPARLAYLAALFQSLVLVVYGFLYTEGHATASVGYSVSFFIALGTEVQVLAWRSALTRAASSEEMFRLNALTVVTGQSGQILGTAASGFVLAAIGAASTVYLTSAAYFVSALFGLVVARQLGSIEKHVEVGARGPSQYLVDLRAGVAHIAERPEIAFFYGLILANMTVIFGINAMLAPFVREELHLGAEAFGKIDAAYALGAIVGGFFIVRLARHLGQLVVLLLGLGLAAGSLLVFAECKGLIPAIVIYIGLGLSFQTSVIALSAAQRATDLAYQGRVSASFNAMNAFVGLMVYVAVSISAGHHVYRQLYRYQAVMMLCIVPVVLVASRRGAIRRLLKPATNRRATAMVAP